jgi:hypothetical protein
MTFHVVCSSKPLPASASSDISKFDFPRIPSSAGVDVRLRQMCFVQAQSYKRNCSNDLGLQAGFGLLEDKEKQEVWAKQINVTVGEPRWVVDDHDKSTGRWREDVKFASVVTFRCAPPFSVQNMTTSVSTSII